MEYEKPEGNLVEIFLNRTLLDGELVIPVGAQGIVVFAHGSGSSLASPRNKFVSHMLHKYHLATLMFNLLTTEEARDSENRFNIDLLTHRLVDTTCWLIDTLKDHPLPIGYFGASTGAAAALRASVILKDKVRTVVSRGGRPDLAGNDLCSVTCPAVLIVGGNDKEVLALNQQAMKQLTGVKQLVVIPGAYHLFEEGQELFDVAKVAAVWFSEYLKETPKQLAL